MQIVIDIPKELYERAKVNIMETMDFRTVRAAIFNGTPLPEHHRRLLILDEGLVERNLVSLNATTSFCNKWLSEVGISNSVVKIIPATETPTKNEDDKYTKVPACNGYTFYVPKQIEEKEKSCKDCGHGFDSEDCYKCDKNIQNTCEPNQTVTKEEPTTEVTVHTDVGKTWKYLQREGE